MGKILVPTFQMGQDGNIVFSANTNLNPVKNTFAGSPGSNAPTIGSFSGLSVGDLLLLHQTQGGTPDLWEMARIISLNSGINPITINRYLTNTFNAQAQFVRVPRYGNVTVNAGVILNTDGWNGSFGGIAAAIANGTFTLNGQINMDYLGFRGQGGEGNGAYVGRRGEGNTGNDAARNTSNQGNGAGAGGYSNNGPWDQGNGAGGGSNSTNNVQNGTGTGGGNNSNGPAGTAGIAAGAADLLSAFSLGGAGGEGGNNSSSSGSGYGGNGAGAIVIIAKKFVMGATGVLSALGQYGGQHNFHSGSGGSGAGGSILIICEEFVWNNGAVIQAVGGAHVHSNSSGTPGDADGGQGGDGRVSIAAGKITVNSGSFIVNPSYYSNAYTEFLGKVGLLG